jgi:hypothetical protein
VACANFSTVYDEQIWQVFSFFAYGLRPSRVDAEEPTQLTFERALRSCQRCDASKASVATGCSSSRATRSSLGSRRSHRPQTVLWSREVIREIARLTRRRARPLSRALGGLRSLTP